MIEGLKLTMTGEQVRKRLAVRIKQHEQLVTHYMKEAAREPDPNDDYDFVLPEHMCEYEQELHGWHADALTFIREHIEGGETYRLGPADLAFAELLPPKPGLVRQEEYERQERVGFSLERIAKEIGRTSFGLDPLQLAKEEHARIAEAGKTGRARRRPPKAAAGRK
jgi:hypothetical protein